jgi:hypothetical protein
MDAEARSLKPTGNAPPRGLDWISAVMAWAIVLLLGWAAWLWFGPKPLPEPLQVGSVLPPLRLIDLESSQPLVLLNFKGKIVWVVFWSAASPAARSSLQRLDMVWKQFRSHRRFALVAAAVDADRPEQVRAALAAVQGSLPVYLAGPETKRRFGVDRVDPPLHFLVDVQGRIAALARGAGRETIDRLADQAQRWLDELDPLGKTWFALAVGRLGRDGTFDERWPIR